MNFSEILSSPWLLLNGLFYREHRNNSVIRYSTFIHLPRFQILTIPSPRVIVIFSPMYRLFSLHLCQSDRSILCYCHLAYHKNKIKKVGYFTFYPSLNFERERERHLDENIYMNFQAW